MKIEYKISANSLGENSTEDNQRYVAAVKTALQSEYPTADISVELEHRESSSTCWVTTENTENDTEIYNNVLRISNLIWDRAEY